MRFTVLCSFRVSQVGLTFLLFILLTACTPSLEPAGQAGQEGTQEVVSANQPEVLWTAQVSRVERYQGSYQGESGSAVVQDGQVLELKLSNHAFTDTVGFYENSLDSPPMLLSYIGAGLFPRRAVVTFDNDLPAPSFAGEAETNFVIEDGFVTGSLRFTGQDDIGQQVDVVVENIRVTY